MKRILMDERTQHVNGTVAFYCLMLTQLSLAAVILVKRYILGQPPEAYAEIVWIALLSMGIYWAIRLYLSGILPVISFKSMLLIYVTAVLVISVPTYFIHGWPAPERWFEVLYPVIGVAVIMLVYWLIAYFGKKRLDKYNKE